MRRKTSTITIVVIVTMIISGSTDLGCRREVYTEEPEARSDLHVDQNGQAGWKYNGERVEELRYDEEMFAGPETAKREVEEVLGAAEILVYRNGEKILVDPESACHKLLKVACEEMLTSAEFLTGTKIESLPGLEEVKREECAIELNYAQPIRLVFGMKPSIATTIAQSHVTASHFLIPLTGELTQLVAKGERSLDEEYVYIFVFPEVVSDACRLAIGTTKDIGRIRDILTLFNISIPVN